jgi:hypothetical protein
MQVELFTGKRKNFKNALIFLTWQKNQTDHEPNWKYKNLMEIISELTY